MPKHTVRDHPVRLECHYEMEGDALYAVKWYKDGNEFYRYVPRDNPPIQVFDLKGINVDVSNPRFHIRFHRKATYPDDYVDENDFSCFPMNRNDVLQYKGTKFFQRASCAGSSRTGIQWEISM